MNGIKLGGDRVRSRMELRFRQLLPLRIVIGYPCLGTTFHYFSLLFTALPILCLATLPIPCTIFSTIYSTRRSRRSPMEQHGAYVTLLLRHTVLS